MGRGGAQQKRKGTTSRTRVLLTRTTWCTMQLPCPAESCCSQTCRSFRGLQRHWQYRHQQSLGPLEFYKRRASDATFETVDGVKKASATTCLPIPTESTASCSKDPPPSALVSTAMSHIDQMTYRFAQTDAEVARAKSMAASCLEALKPELQAALHPHVHDGVEVSSLITPLLAAFKQIGTKKNEARERCERASHPPLRAYARDLGERPAKLGKRKCIDGLHGEAWDICFEEALEREIHYDHSLLTQIIVADQYWTRRAKELRESDPRDPSRTFQDQVDGEVWQSHPILGDPTYDGPPRIAFQGYCDDVDVPNALGPAAGHHKLYIQTVSIINRPPRGRMTMRAQMLSTVCLSTDFKAFGANKVISGTGTSEFSLGATCRRLWTHGTIRLPVELSPDPLACRAFLTVWCADGMAMGDVCGTNTSFSKCKNPCNTCEDLDQACPAKRVPCSILRCLCGEADKHRRGCPCHFRLRTPNRDRRRATALQPPSKATMQALGITTLEPPLLNIPGIHAARPGPKDTMHTLNEGRTGQLGAVTCWHVVAAGLATAEELQRRAATFDWNPGSSSGFFRPNYLPDKIFVSTKVYQPDGTWVWGPHKDIKIPGSAVGVATFAIMSVEFFRPFFPPYYPIPPWYQAWRRHRSGFCMALRYRFTLSDLLIMETHFIESESIIQAWPAYTLLWIPKAHWTLHLAHDIWLWGPSRLLATFLNEMKNARFKAGAKRGNFHHPVKDVATFWAKQSDYELQSMPAVSHACVTSVEKSIIVSGTAASFSDSVAAGLLVKHSIVEPSTQLDFMSSFTFHGVPIYRQDHILFDTKVYMVHRLLRADSQYYMLLHEVAKSLALDDMDEYFVPVQHTVERPMRFVHVHSTCDITCFWAVPVESRLYLIPKI